ncbi:MAG: hypothetical protein HPY89_12920 [Pelotomaculum sp.]|uniref:Uncharacterized protein n=1 Tax=Pelotomaculum thermopropionicum (strain DSM 13744 / JCM 10971 / SI) TaxID=370438 RepID=A5CY66_PELTS|nr:hypothetical protein [Pelotomaculum sp.]BAF61056.1 hypothetical protein PTH_2875 [Pelotomaculum thermopropionicum SI]
MPVNFCVDTITALLQGSLPPPKRGIRQEGFGGWWYSLVEVGGSTPPPGRKAGGQPARLWRLEWWGGQPPPKPGLTAEQIRELLSLPPWVYTHSFSKTNPDSQAPELPRDGSYLCLYVAPHKGILHWWYSQVTVTVQGKHRSQGDLPLVYTTKETDRDSLMASVGVMLWQQVEVDLVWKQDFEKWLWRWVAGLIGEEGAGYVTDRLLRQYYPVIYSPEVYVKRCAKGRRYLSKQKRPQEGTNGLVETFSPAEKAAAVLGISKQALYYRLRRSGYYSETASRQVEGTVTVKRAVRHYDIDEKTVAAVGEEIKQSQIHRGLVKAVVDKRGVGVRAAQRWVQRRIKAGKTPKEILDEIYRHRCN